MLGAISCGLNCSYLDVAPRYASLWNTIGNTCGALAGVFGPILVSYLQIYSIQGDTVMDMLISWYFIFTQKFLIPHNFSVININILQLNNRKVKNVTFKILNDLRKAINFSITLLNAYCIVVTSRRVQLFNYGVPHE